MKHAYKSKTYFCHCYILHHKWVLLAHKLEWSVLVLLSRVKDKPWFLESGVESYHLWEQKVKSREQTNVPPFCFPLFQPLFIIFSSPTMLQHKRLPSDTPFQGAAKEPSSKKKAHHTHIWAADIREDHVSCSPSKVGKQAKWHREKQTEGQTNRHYFPVLIRPLFTSQQNTGWWRGTSCWWIVL